MKPPDSQRQQHYVTLNHFLCHSFILCHTSVLIIYLLWAPCLSLSFSHFTTEASVPFPLSVCCYLSFNFTIISEPSLCISIQPLSHFPGLCFTFISAHLLMHITPLLYKAARGCIACKYFDVCCMSFMLMGQKKPCSTKEAVMCGIVCFHPSGKQTNTKRKKNYPGPKVLKERSHLFLLHAWKVTCTFSHVQVTADTLLHLLYKM